MLGAVAMSFGLFAAGTPYQTSFEAADGCTTGLTPDGVDWSGITTEIPVGLYSTDTAAKFVYPESGAAARRTGWEGSVNDQFLKLETGSDTLLRKIGDENLVVDQLVKFTGFEEDQVFEADDTTKIAVWLKAIEADDTAAEPVTGVTNLYVTVGGKSGDVPLQIGADNAYAVDTWYRLTIKSLGNVASSGDRAGFVIYINGEQVASSDEAAKYLFDEDQLTPAAWGIQQKGKLFPARTTKDAVFTSVGYKGIGGIDDLVIDTDGPEFCQAVTVNPLLPADVSIIDIKDADGNTVDFDPDTFAFAVPAGTTVTIYFDTVEGKFLTKESVDKTIEEAGELDLTSDVEAKDLVVTVSWFDGEEDQAKDFDNLEEALAAVVVLQKGSPAVLNFEIDIQADCEAFDAAYMFTEGTHISIDGESNPGYSIWNITGGDVTYLADVENKKIITVTDGTLTLAGLIKSGAVVTAEAITVGEGGIELSLADEEKGEAASVVITKSVLDLVNDFVVPEGYKISKTAATTEELEDYWIYALAECDYVCEIDGQGYESLAEALEDAENDDTIKLLADITLTETATITKAITLDLNKFEITFAADLAKGIAAADVTDAITIKNGKFVAADRANMKGSMAFDLLRTSAVFTDVEIDVPGFEYVLSHMGNIGTDKKPYWTVTAPYTIDCNNVDIKGNGSLFHIEYAIADLDANCSATASGTSFGGAHEAAIYSSCGAVVTVNGGTYTAPNALQTGNLGGDIIVKGGEFNGNIKSWMLDNDTRAFADVNEANITIEGGKFTGNFVYAADCSANSSLLKVAITGGDFSDKNIPVKFIANTPAAGYQNAWVASETEEGYVTPGAEAITYNITYTFTGVEAGDESKIMNPNAETTTYTVEDAITFKAAECEGYEFKGFDPAEIEAGTTGDQTIVGTFAKKQQGWDVPTGDEDKPASEVWETIPNDLADVPAGRISTWAKTYSVPFGGEFTDTMKDAYLLNCDPNDSAKIAAEKAKINIASIEFVNGEWVVKTVSGNVETQEFGNGKLVLEDVTESITGAEGSDAAKLWKMKLVPITAAK